MQFVQRSNSDKTIEMKNIYAVKRFFVQIFSHPTKLAAKQRKFCQTCLKKKGSVWIVMYKFTKISITKRRQLPWFVSFLTVAFSTGLINNTMIAKNDKKLVQSISAHLKNQLLTPWFQYVGPVVLIAVNRLLRHSVLVFWFPGKAN